MRKHHHRKREEKRSPFREQILRLKARVKLMPTEPGVYRWLDQEGTVLYVGKAKNLRKRLRSYVTGSHEDEHAFKQVMWERMWDVDITVTRTEVEALTLEMHLIRTLKPPYNIALKRDRSTVYVRIGMQEAFPSVTLTHQRHTDGARYFGPFHQPSSQDHLLTILRRIFPFRTCSMGIEMRPALEFEVSRVGGKAPMRLELQITKPDRRTPCFDHHIARCCAPCGGDVSIQEYRERCIDGVLEFYEGKFDRVIERLTEHMQAIATQRRYERAAELRDTLQFIERLQKKYPKILIRHGDIDVIGLSATDHGWQFVVLQVRGGSIVNEVKHVLEGSGDRETVLMQFVPQYYGKSGAIPDLILIGHALRDRQLLQNWLKTEAEKSVKIEFPTKGEKRKLIELAERNAAVKLHVETVKQKVGDQESEAQLSLFA